jgi:23S rRNA (cytosine1962-C5)-methyltransferase
VDLELPDVTVDLFGEVAVLSVYSEAAQAQEPALTHALNEARDLRAVYVKRRPREARALASQAAGQLAPGQPLSGEPVAEVTALEAGAAFEIRPGNGLSVGLYLDSRDARAWVRAHARGRRVLNTFAYTCGFGLAALLGGASRAVNLDLSRKVLEWGERNYAHNRLAAERYDFISGDTFDWLGRFAKKQEQFDLVVLDPPGFATLKRGRFSGARDYHLLVEAAAPVVAPGGLLLAMCNVEALTPAGFEAQLARGLGARRATQVSSFGASAVDYRQPSGLKCLVYELA